MRRPLGSLTSSMFSMFLMFVIPLFVVMLTACGRGDGGVTTNASRVLARDVAAVRLAVEAQDRAAADHALAKLGQDVARLRVSRLVTEGAAARVVDAAGVVHTRLELLPAPTTTTSTTTAPVPTSKPEKGHDGKGKGDGGHGGD